jgi:hypothetical protein
MYIYLCIPTYIFICVYIHTSSEALRIPSTASCTVKPLCINSLYTYDDDDGDDGDDGDDDGYDDDNDDNDDDDGDDMNILQPPAP